MRWFSVAVACVLTLAILPAAASAADPTQCVIEQYPQRNQDGSTVYVFHWCDGRWTYKPLSCLRREYPELQPDGRLLWVMQWCDGTWTWREVPRQQPAPVQPQPQQPTPSRPSGKLEYYENILVVQPGELRWVSISLAYGERVSGSFCMEGGRDIEFTVQDPNGQTIQWGGRAEGCRTFALAAQTTGVYSLVFDNSYSWFTNKVLRVKFNYGSY